MRITSLEHCPILILLIEVSVQVMVKRNSSLASTIDIGIGAGSPFLDWLKQLMKLYLHAAGAVTFVVLLFTIVISHCTFGADKFGILQQGFNETRKNFYFSR
ncbi:hypothetical protein O6P43_003559 [Quillaja saponaria]|uniref:Uncharacterized protein n=1 Tax=Quillaja saponaria TaxID=32244 RepID=A0AAD7QEZ6_QUISA|nr:hypothetical protein O6P43_003559 [Quillaja saponaria]